MCGCNAGQTNCDSLWLGSSSTRWPRHRQTLRPIRKTLRSHHLCHYFTDAVNQRKQRVRKEIEMFQLWQLLLYMSQFASAREFPRNEQFQDKKNITKRLQSIKRNCYAIVNWTKATHMEIIDSVAPSPVRVERSLWKSAIVLGVSLNGNIDTVKFSE